MEYSIEFDSNECDMYQVDKSRLIIHTYDREYTLFKRVHGSYKGDGLVKKKDFSINAKSRLKEHILVRFDYYNDFKIELISKGELGRYIKKYTALEDKLIQEDKEKEREWKELQKLRGSLRTNRSMLQKLLQVDEEELQKEELIKFNNFLISINEKLKAGMIEDRIEIKETKATMLTNKSLRISLYKSKIDNYIDKGKFQSINRLCKDLRINRQTLYNYKLDKYINKLIRK